MCNKEVVSHKTCTKCGEHLPLEFFYKQKAGKYGVKASCKECHKIQNQEYYQRESHKCKLLVRNWRVRNMKKVRDYQRVRRDAIKKVWIEFRNNPNRHNALEVLHKHAWNGLIEIPKICQICGSDEELEPYVRDLDKKDGVVWCCEICYTGLMQLYATGIRRRDLVEVNG